MVRGLVCQVSAFELHFAAHCGGGKLCVCVCARTYRAQPPLNLALVLKCQVNDLTGVR